MADTPNPGETVNPEAPSNTPVQTPAATPPVANASDPADVERLRKELEQANLRARQLENEKAAREKADEEAEAKRLESNQEYKTLLEQEREKRLALEREAEEREQKAELTEAKSGVLKDFSDEVKVQAEKLGIDLTASDETSVAAFKEKLDTINTGLVNNGTITPNNPHTPTQKNVPTGDDLRTALRDENGLHDIVMKNFPGIAAMTNPKK